MVVLTDTRTMETAMPDLDDLADDLDAFLADDGEPEYDIDSEPPELEDAEAANRLLRRIDRLKRQAAGIDRVADAEAERIGAWRVDRKAGIAATIAWTDQSLESWLRAQAALDPRVKTVKLPNGTVTLRPRQPRIVVEDQAVAVQAIVDVLEVPELVETKRTVRGDALKQIAQPGPILGPPDAEGYAPHAAVVIVTDDLPDGPEQRAIVIPGVVFMVNPQTKYGSPATE